MNSLFDPGMKEVRPPGFEPGLQAWKACIITPRLWPQSLEDDCQGFRFKSIDRKNPTGRVSGRLGSFLMRASSHLPFSNRSVEGLHHILMERFPLLFVPTGQWKASILMGEANSLLSSMVSGRLQSSRRVSGFISFTHFSAFCNRGR